MPMSKPRKFLIGVIALVAAFLAGYVPATLDARAARAERAEAVQKFVLAELQVRLGMMIYELNRDNYGFAAQLATEFFDGVQAAVAGPGGTAVADALRTTLARRDEITTDLAQANSGVKAKVAEMFAGLYRLSRTP